MPLKGQGAARARRKTVVVRRFHYSPDESAPGCVCSVCGMQFTDDEPPIRMFEEPQDPGEYTWELRFHSHCLTEIFEYVDGKFYPREDVDIKMEWGADWGFEVAQAAEPRPSPDSPETLLEVPVAMEGYAKSLDDSVWRNTTDDRGPSMDEVLLAIARLKEAGIVTSSGNVSHYISYARYKRHVQPKLDELVRAGMMVVWDGQYYTTEKWRKVMGAKAVGGMGK